MGGGPAGTVVGEMQQADAQVILGGISSYQHGSKHPFEESWRYQVAIKSKPNNR
jgi:hypothetical protein